MAYCKDCYDHFDFEYNRGMINKKENQIDYLKREIIPNIKNSALLLQEALLILGKEKDDIVENTINDNDPSYPQMKYIFVELHKILSDKRRAIKLDGSKYKSYYMAWMNDYKMKFNYWLEGNY